MKALLVSEIFPPIHGGSGRWFWEMYSRLPEQDYVFAVGVHEQQAEFDSNTSLSIHRIHLSSPQWGIKSLTGLKYYIKSFFTIRKIVKNEGVNQIHCGRCLPEGVIAYLMNLFYGIPYLCYIHGEDIEVASLSRELSWIVKKVFSRASALIANSNNTRELLIKKWAVPKERTRLLHPGVDSEKFRPIPDESKFAQEQGDYSHPMILTVGRLQKRKGQDMLIKAMPEILKEFPSANYIIIGDGGEKSRLLALIDELSLHEQVKILSEATDETMINCYQSCDLFVLPNRQVGNDIEGFGMVLVEAQACGKPVIAGDSGGTAETMIIGETGFITDCTDPSLIAKEVCKLLANDELRKNMGVRARAHVIEKLDWKTIAQKGRSIFTELGQEAQ